MAYSHGEQWNTERICKAIMEVVEMAGEKVMPSHKDMDGFFGNHKLSCAVSKHGGSKMFADILQLPLKSCETKFGEKFENLCAEKIQDEFGFDVEKTEPRHPYDLLVDNCVKVDVKAGKITRTKDGREYYTFNLEKRHQTCDIFVCYCLNERNEIKKILVIPSCALSGKTQLSVGVKESKYDLYIDGWERIYHYSRFMRGGI